MPRTMPNTHQVSCEHLFGLLSSVLLLLLLLTSSTDASPTIKRGGNNDNNSGNFRMVVVTKTPRERQRLAAFAEQNPQITFSAALGTGENQAQLLKGLLLGALNARKGHHGDAHGKYGGRARKHVSDRYLYKTPQRLANHSQNNLFTHPIGEPQSQPVPVVFPLSMCQLVPTMSTDATPSIDTAEPPLDAKPCAAPATTSSTTEATTYNNANSLSPTATTTTTASTVRRGSKSPSYKRSLDEDEGESEEAADDPPPIQRLRMMHDGLESSVMTPVSILTTFRQVSVEVEEVVPEEEDSPRSSQSPESYTTDSSDSGTAHMMYLEPYQRKEVLDMSINKLQTLNGRAPSLRKSVLIFNTMRYLQQDEASSGDTSPTSSGDEDLELDLPDDDDTTNHSPLIGTSQFDPIIYSGGNNNSTKSNAVHEWSMQPPTQVLISSPWTPTEQEQHQATHGGSSNIAGEILLSYEMLNNGHHSGAPSTPRTFSVHLDSQAHDEEEEEEDSMDEAQVIAALGLTEVVQAIMAD